VLLGVGVVSGYRLGPLPFWQDVPGGSSRQVHQFSVTAHAQAMARAVALIPSGVPVSASNPFGGRLSARPRILTWPVIGDAQWVIVDQQRPWVIDKHVKPRVQAPYLRALERNPAFALVSRDDGVLVFARRTALRRPA
jgi:hypothetical protein